MFIIKFNTVYDEYVTELMAKTPGFKQWYINSILSDTAGTAGIETIRRINGMANVKDITEIKDSDKRTRAERIAVVFAKDCIMNRDKFKCGEDYLLSIDRAVKNFAL